MTDPLTRTRRDYDAIAEQYEDLVRHSPDFCDPVQSAMVLAVADLVRSRPTAPGEPLPDGAVVGVLAHFSLIHLPRGLLPSALA